MKKLLLFLFLVPTILSAQEATWFKAGYGPSSNYSSALTQDASGNLISAGTYGEQITFGATVLPGDDFGQSIFIVKYDAAGQQLWTKSLLGSYVAQVVDLEVDASGNIFIIGDFSDVVDFDPSGATHNITLVNGTFLAKYDASGSLLWVHSFELSGAWVEKELALDATGNAYFAGSFSFQTDFDPSSGTAILSPINSDMPFLASYDTNGSYRWAVSVEVSSGYVYGVAVHGNSVFLAGYVYGEADFDPTPNVDGGGVEFSFVSKYSTAGNYISTFGVGEGEQFSSLTAMSVDNTGNIFVGGNLSGATDFDPSSGEAILTPAEDSNNIFVTKYSNNGDYLWAKAISGDDSIQDLNLAADTNGNVAVAGLFQGNLDADPSQNVEFFESVGFNDGFVSRLNANGDYLDSVHIGLDYDGIKGDSYDRITGIVLTNDALFVSGGVAGPFDFDDDGPLAPMVFEENTAIEAFLVKYAVTPSLSVQQVDGETAIVAWPNPTTGIVRLQNNTQPFAVYDVFGRQLSHYSAAETSIDLSGFASGTYILKTATTSVKILKN